MSTPPPRAPRLRAVLFAALALGAFSGCASARPALRAAMEPLPIAGPPKLAQDHFDRDHTGTLSEAELREILDAPVFLEEGARVAVVSVRPGYRIDEELPLARVTAELCTAMQDSGLFELASETATDWPTDGGVAGLRELAARYRAEYLLLYRHRFVDRSYVNGWATTWFTFVGGFLAPFNTIESAGLLEATLFDVRTGTILFTGYERVYGLSDENMWHNDRKRRAMKQRLLDGAAERLGELVVGKMRRLAAARPRAVADVSYGARQGSGEGSSGVGGNEQNSQISSQESPIVKLPLSQ